MFYLQYRPYIAIQYKLIIFFIFLAIMEGVVKVEWHGQDYLHLKWHVVCSGLATSAPWMKNWIRNCDQRQLH